MKILITGSAGFIGYNLAENLLGKKGFKITGVDNFNDYYDVNLKKKRNNILKKFKNFEFIKVDINDKINLEKIFKKKKFDFVFHFAAQAGVRYSIDHPRKYVESNIIGFYNILENTKKYKIKRLFYASSSSVYGENKNFPLKEKEKILPKNIYGLTKKIDEEIGLIFNKYYKVKLIGLRFFTIYGEWGRPDMMMIKFINSYYKNKTFELYNFGKHVRDFTYVGDAVNIMFLLLRNHKKLNNYDIFNICSNNPINLKEIILFLKKNKINPKIKKVTLQKADILKTHGDNSKLLKYIKFKKFSNWKESVKKTIIWYQKNML
ncbi:MAG: NAD-dependent epimerase/dehydratase family protein [Rickettsiales bacterium TMED254]|nr:MAG: NAD-dependent epimerase/dehydratase family protein [Rickettsiales bacterium TMED254]